MRTFCIVLPEQPERTKAAREHFKAIGLDGVEWFDGIAGEAFGLQTCWPYELDKPGSGDKIPPPLVGIWLSHVMLWRTMDLLAGERFMVLESDAEFATGWHQRLDDALRDVPPDFDMLYIGSCCCADKPKTQIKGEIFHVTWPFCTHAIVIAKKALPVLIATLRRCWAPVDIQLTLEAHLKLKVYTVLPRIVGQFAAYTSTKPEMAGKELPP